MKTRIIWTKIWEDEWFSVLSHGEKLLFVYLITNHRIGLSGCYELSDKAIRIDLDITQEQLENAKKSLNPKAIFYKGWVYIKNAQRLNGFKGEKNMTALKRELEEIPSEVRNTIITPKSYRVSGFDDRVSPFDDTPINHKSEIINNKSEIINHKEDGKKYTELKEMAHKIAEEKSIRGK